MRNGTHFNGESCCSLMMRDLIKNEVEYTKLDLGMANETIFKPSLSEKFKHPFGCFFYLYKDKHYINALIFCL